MSKREILAGATDQTVDVFIQDSSSTVGAGLTGLVFNTSGLTCYYRKGATGTPTALTLATQTVGGAHSDGGFVAVDGTNCPGQYRLDLSDTIVATAGMVTLYLRGATNMAPCILEIEVVSVNKFDSVRMGLTALPNAAADAAGGLPISDAGGLDLDALNSNVSAVLADTGTDGVVVAAGSKTGYALSSTGMDAVTLPANIITATSIATDAITAAKIAADAIGASELAADAVTEIQSGLATAAKLLAYIQLLARSDAAIATDNATELTAINADGGSGAGDFSNQTDAVEALRDHVGDGTNLTEAGGTGDQLTALATAAQATAIEADTQDIQTRIPAALVNSRMDATVDGTGMEGGAITAIWTTALTEAYRSTGAAGTAAQLLHEILQNLTEFDITSTTKTVKKFDGSTTAKTYTLDDATTPTSITETT